MRYDTGDKMITTSINIPAYFLEKARAMVNKGMFPSVCEIMRLALIQFFENTEAFVAFLEQEFPKQNKPSDIIQFGDGTTKTIIKKGGETI